MRDEYPTLSNITRFYNQYTITKNLDIHGTVRLYNLANYHNHYALVMEDFGGISLSSYMSSFAKQKSKGKLPLTQFLHIAIKIASTLAEVHRHYIIHKNIKPTNILIHPNTLEVKLIDFSIASVIPKEIQGESVVVWIFLKKEV